MVKAKAGVHGVAAPSVTGGDQAGMGMTDSDAPKVMPALTPAEFLIILSLSPEPAYGYRIMQLINDVFRTDTRIGPGTLYRALQRLASNGLIEEAGDALGEDEDERRKLYRLTARGHEVARKELQRLETLTRLARARLGGK
jgi:DNA-binding PadR family transcriptional regulator